jgi:hypothetical protein
MLYKVVVLKAGAMQRFPGRPTRSPIDCCDSMLLLFLQATNARVDGGVNLVVLTPRLALAVPHSAARSIKSQ